MLAIWLWMAALLGGLVVFLGAVELLSRLKPAGMPGSGEEEDDDDGGETFVPDDW